MLARPERKRKAWSRNSQRVTTHSGLMERNLLGYRNGSAAQYSCRPANL